MAGAPDFTSDDGGSDYAGYVPTEPGSGPTVVGSDDGDLSHTPGPIPGPTAAGCPPTAAGSRQPRTPPSGPALRGGTHSSSKGLGSILVRSSWLPVAYQVNQLYD